MVRQGHLIAVVVRFLIGCTVLLLVVGCSGTSSESPKQQGHTEATREQTRSAKAASEEARCEGTQTYHLYVIVYPNGQNTLPRSGSQEDMKKADKKTKVGKTRDLGVYTTNDLPGCPKGGLLLGTDKPDLLDGKHGDDEVRGLGGADEELEGGPGNDILYGGDGDDMLEPPGVAGYGEDVMYGGDGNDFLTSDEDGQRDKLYCGEGKDLYLADNNDYVDSSCEKRLPSSYGTAG